MKHLHARSCSLDGEVCLPPCPPSVSHEPSVRLHPLQTLTPLPYMFCSFPPTQPAFYDELPGAVKRHEDRTFGMVRVEITCANCGGHLGHEFKGEGFPTPTDSRHCVNSVSIKFEPTQ